MDSELITFAEAAALLPKPGGTPINASTLYRWYATGVRGVHLECRAVGRRLFTTRAALDAFTLALAAAGPARRPRKPKETTARQRSAKDRERAILAAESRI